MIGTAAIPHVIRTERRPDDVRLFVASWTAQLRQVRPWRSFPDVAEAYRDAVIIPLARTCEALVLTSREDDDHILGYCLFGRIDGGLAAIHITYVMDYYRHRGLARMMIDAVRGSGVAVYTHPTRTAHEFARRVRVDYWPQLATWGLGPVRGNR